MSSDKNAIFHPGHRLNRAQQLTLNTWRFAARKLERVLEPLDLLERVAVLVVLSILREVEEPMALFRRQAVAEPELALVQSLVRDSPHADLDFDILETAFLLRWNELVADARGPEELASLFPRDPR